MLHRVFAVFALLLLSACALPREDPPVNLGDFRLGHVAVVVNDPEIGPFSREATNEELQAGLEKAIRDRFGPYQGDKFYHIGLKLDLYALAQAGVPVVFTPKSVFVATVTIWDDSTQSTLGPDGGKALTVFETASAETFVSSGLTQSKQQQIENLSFNTARAIQDYLLENPQWFGLPPLVEPGTESN